MIATTSQPCFSASSSVLADMVGVAVRDRDQVDALRLLLGVRALRVSEEGST